MINISLRDFIENEDYFFYHSSAGKIFNENVWSMWLTSITELRVLTRKDIMLKNNYLLDKLNASFLIRL